MSEYFRGRIRAYAAGIIDKVSVDGDINTAGVLEDLQTIEFLLLGELRQRTGEILKKNSQNLKEE